MQRSRLQRKIVSVDWLIAVAAFVLVHCDARTSPPPDASASALIGPSGGTVSVAGATVTVPPGALDAPQTLTVRATSLPAPDGYVLYSPIFEFEPAGIRFAAPVLVRIDFVGDASRAEFFWSRDVGPGYDVLAATRSGSSLSAPVTHFSTGWVGSPASPDATVSGGDAADITMPDTFDDLTDAPTDHMSFDGGLDAGDGTDISSRDAATMDAPFADAVGGDAAASDAMLACSDAGAGDGGSGITCTFTRTVQSMCVCGLPPSSCVTQYNVPVTIGTGTGCCSASLTCSPTCSGRVLRLNAAATFSAAGGFPDFQLDCAPPLERWTGGATTLPPGCTSSWLTSTYGGTITVTNGTDVSLDVTYTAEPGGSAYNCSGVSRGCTIYTVHCFGTATAM